MLNSIKFGLVLALGFISSTSFCQELEFVEEEDGILLRENSEPRYFYQTSTKSIEGKFPRANYVHPLYGLDGKVITEDFPDDHPHHHGIFWAWHQLFAEGERIGDPWFSDGITWEVRVKDTRIVEKTAQLEAEIFWVQVSDKDSLVKENLLLIFERLAPDVFTLSFEIKLTALKEGVAIGGSEDQKGYGGFSARLKLPEDIQFNSSNGNVVPQNLPVEAGPWINLVGRYQPTSDTTSGIVLMTIPEELPSYQGWILRSAKSMQNSAFPGRIPLPIPKEESIEFRNQVLIHRDLSSEEISSYYKRFRNKTV